MKLAFNIFARWGLFAIYLALLFTLPVAILGRYLGLGLGISFTSLFLFYLYYRGEEKIFNKLNLANLSQAESPEAYNVVKEISRRLNLPSPKIAKLNSDALNIGIFGLSKKRTYLIVTDGLLQNTNRSEFTALVARELTAVWYGDCILSSWFSRLLAIIEVFSTNKFSNSNSERKNIYSLQWLIFQIIFLPLALVPQLLLLGIRRSVNLDLESLKLSQLPSDLAESYRLIMAGSARNSLRAPGSTTPLFLLCPTQYEPISKLFLNYPQTASLSSAIKQMRKYT